MSLLSDRDIARELVNRRLKIEPWDQGQLQPASYDCRLGDELLIPNAEVVYVDPQTGGSGPEWLREPGEVMQEGLWPPPMNAEQERERYRPWLPVVMSERLVQAYPWYPKHQARVHGLWLAPGQFVLGSTVERFEIPDYLASRIEGKSSLGRWGLVVHVTAGFVDPGFRGQLTLELRNVGPFHLLLRAGMLVSQVSFTLLSSRAERPYGSVGLGSHYQGQDGAQGAL